MTKLILVAVMLVAGCGNNRVVAGTEYGTYGLFNEDTGRNPNVEYRLIVGNVVWSVILVRTIIAPVYFIGFSLYEPVGPKGGVVPGAVIRPGRE